jgi:hypothetical protein
MSSIVRQRISSSFGEHTSTASACAREIATFRRFRDTRFDGTRRARPGLEARIGNVSALRNDQPVWEVTDRSGRRVVLPDIAWAHIVEEHPDIRIDEQDVLAAVAAPTRRIAGREPGEEWCYLAGPGPTRWLKVVVHYEGNEGHIVTAFPRRAFP